MAAVTMLHPPSGRVQQASRGAFERVWQHQGWVLVEEDRKAEMKAGERVFTREQIEHMDSQPVGLTQPGPRDNKAAWVDWAVHNGADRIEAESMTKKDLIAAFGE